MGPRSLTVAALLASLEAKPHPELKRPRQTRASWNRRPHGGQTGKPRRPIYTAEHTVARSGQQPAVGSKPEPGGRATVRSSRNRCQCPGKRSRWQTRRADQVRDVEHVEHLRGGFDPGALADAEDFAHLEILRNIRVAELQTRSVLKQVRQSLVTGVQLTGECLVVVS